MDPVTAIFNFLATAAGQVICEDLHKASVELADLVKGLIKKIHDKE